VAPLLAAAAAAVVIFGAVTAIAASEAPNSGLSKPTVVYVCGHQPRGLVMARIDARSPGIRGHSLKVIRASVRRPEPPPGSPKVVSMRCSMPRCSFGEDADATELFPEPFPLAGEDADAIELRPGPFSLAVKVERRFPLPSAYTPASVFEINADITVRGGRCYALVMTCEGEATNGATCHLKLKQKSCAPLRSPRRIVLPSISAC
jgi:hypothetical protein